MISDKPLFILDPFLPSVLQMAPVGDVVLLYNLTVVWTSILESLYQRSWKPKIQIPSLILCVVGMALVTQPSFLFPTSVVSHSPTSTTSDGTFSHPLSTLHPSHPSRHPSLSSLPPPRPHAASPTLPPPHRSRAFWGYSLSLASSFFYSVIYVMVSCRPNVHWSAWIMPLGLSHLLFGAVLISFISHAGGRVYLLHGSGSSSSSLSSSSWTPVVSLLLIGVFNVTAEVGSTMAIQADSASLSALVATAQIPLAYVWAALWLGEAVDVCKLVGITLVFAALVLVIVYEWRQEKKEKNDGEGEEDGDDSLEDGDDTSVSSLLLHQNRKKDPT